MASRIMGHVVDRDRRPIGNVKVHLKGKRVAESGADGFFSVTIARPESRVALTFSADGYVSNTRVYDSRATAMYGVVLWPVAYRVRFDPSRDLDVELGGSRIQVPANALAPATDLAVLRFTLFDITSPLQRAAAPGDFSGRMLDGSLRRLNSYGIFDLGVQDPGGRALGLRREARIDLAVAVSRRLSGNAPRQVGFFDFDTRPGLWNQIGTFELAAEALTYNGSVTSLGGAHNLDDPQDTVCVTLKVEDSNGQPVPNADIDVHGAQYTSGGTTNAGGFVCLLVQRNASFSVLGFAMVGSSTWMTMSPQTFTSPDFSSGAGDCGDPLLCPVVGTVTLYLVVKLPQ